MTMKNKPETAEQIRADIETNAIYKITDHANTPPEVKKFLLDYLFEKTGISVDFFADRQGEPETDGGDQPTCQTVYFSGIKLNGAQAAELATRIFANDAGGAFSADASDDRSKQALLILLSALTYEDESTNRENIFFDVARKIFGYSAAADAAENEFITNGFDDFSSGKWNVPAIS